MRLLGQAVLEARGRGLFVEEDDGQFRVVDEQTGDPATPWVGRGVMCGYLNGVLDTIKAREDWDNAIP